jgi:two-component system nitrate/nitrite response regulator NarL
VKQLTVQQANVMILACAGLSTKRIAAAMDISDHTAKYHLTAAMQRLGATTRALAVAKFTLEHGDWVREKIAEYEESR